MTDDRREIGEIDILAYADGRLERARAEEVEAHLATRPELAKRAADFARQRDELREQFDRYAEEPLPERLQALFAEESDARRPAGTRIAWRAAAAAALMAATGAAGWWLGARDDATTSPTRAFAERAIERLHAEARPPETEVAAAEGLGGRAGLTWLSDRISLELRAPDLSDQGFRLVDKRRVQLDGEQAVALRYADGRGERVEIVLKSRWRDAAPDVRSTRRDGVTVMYWNDGPLAVAVASSVRDAGRLDRLARHVQDTLGRTKDSPDELPKMQPFGGSSGGAQEAGVVEGAEPADARADDAGAM